MNTPYISHGMTDQEVRDFQNHLETHPADKADYLKQIAMLHKLGSSTGLNPEQMKQVDRLCRLAKPLVLAYVEAAYAKPQELGEASPVGGPTPEATPTSETPLRGFGGFAEMEMIRAEPTVAEQVGRDQHMALADLFDSLGGVA